MQIEFHAHGQFLPQRLRADIESKLRNAFARMTQRIRNIRVFLWDSNGPRGGVDKGVRLIVELTSGHAILVRDVAVTPAVAVARAIGRARHAVRNTASRQRTRRRRLSNMSGGVRHHERKTAGSN